MGLSSAPRASWLLLCAPALWSCNALLRLGDEPTEADAGAGGAATSTSASSSPTTSSSSSTTSDGSGTGASSSGGGAGAGGPGGSGAGGDGGSGGAFVPGPPQCGECPVGSVEECGPGGRCEDGRCVVRGVALEGTTLGSATIPGIVVGESRVVVAAEVPGPNVRFFFIDRRTWTASITDFNIDAMGVLAGEPDADRVYYASSAGPVFRVIPEVDPISVLVPENAIRGLLWERSENGVDELVGVDRNDGRLLRLSLRADAGTSTSCELSAPQGDGGFDLARRLDGDGSAAGHAWSLVGDVEDPAWVSTTAADCGATDPVETFALPDGSASAIVSAPGELFGKVRGLVSQGVVVRSERGAERQTSETMALGADAHGVYMSTPAGALDRCDHDLARCSQVAPRSGIQSAQDIEPFEGGIFVTDVFGPPGDTLARLLCIERSELLP